MLDILHKHRIVTVVTVDKVDDGLKVCEALLAAGLPVAEFAFRTPAAPAAISAARKRFPEMHVGAGTLITVDDLRRAMDAGASFAVTPGCNPDIVDLAVKSKFLLAPGVCTPTDIELAMRHGARLLKFFPAEASGGIKMLKALLGPYGHLDISFCPTGGVTTSNMGEYLALKKVSCVAGTWIATKENIQAGAWGEIERIAREARELAAKV